MIDEKMGEVRSWGGQAYTVKRCQIDGDPVVYASVYVKGDSGLAIGSLLTPDAATSLADLLLHAVRVGHTIDGIIPIISTADSADTAEVNRLRAEVRQLKRDLERAESARSTAEHKAREASARAADASRREFEAVRSHDEARKQCDEYKHQLDARNRDYSKLEREFGQQGVRLREAEGAARDAAQRNEELLAELKSDVGSSSAYMKERDDAVASMHAMRRSLDELRASLEALLAGGRRRPGSW